MVNANVGTAWISIVADTARMVPDIDKAIKKAEGSISGEGLGKKLASGLGKTLKVGVASAGVAAGGVLAASLTKGLGRLSGIENAQAKLAGLGHEAEGVESIMENALASVKGTAYGLEDAATVAASAVAAGIKPGADLERTLKLTGDAANIAGVDMATMGSIVNKVATSDMMQMDVANQMMDAGIPILQMVADEMGVTAEEARKMASDGKINFETFQSALEEGVGGAALKAGETVQGSFANMGAAAGRFGAKLADPAFQAAPAIFSSIGTVFDEVNDAITPATEKIGEVLTPALENLATIIEERVAPWMADLAGKAGDLVASGIEKALDPSTWEHIADIFGKVRDTVSELWPSIESLAGSFLTISQSVSVATWEALTSVLDALAPVIESVLVPLLEKVAAFAEENPETVEKMVWAFLAFKGVGAIAGPVGTAAKTLGNLGGAVSGVSKAFKGATFGQGLLTLMGGAKSTNPILAKLGKVIGSVFKVFWKIMPILTKVIGFINPWVAGITIITGALTLFFTKTDTGRKIWETFTEAIAKGIEWIKEKFEAFTGWITTAWDGITSLFKGDYTADLRNAFGIEEDSPIIVGFIKVRDILMEIPDLVRGIADLIFKGDYTGLPFGLEEDSGLVKFILTARDVVIKAGEIITNVFDWIWQAAQTTIAIIGTIVLTPFILAWNLLSWAIRTAWENIIKPVWDAIRDAAVAMWENHIKPALEAIALGWQVMSDKLSAIWEAIKTAVFLAWQSAVETLRGHWETITDAISAAWQRVSDFFSAIWQGIKTFVFDAWNSYVNQVKANWDLVTGALNAAWQVVSDRFTAIWGWIRDNVFQPMMDKISELWNAYASPIFQWVGDKWDWLRDAFGAGWDWIRTNVFDAMGRGLDILKDWFQAGVDGIAKIWEGLKAAAAGPVRFVVDTVWNNGILAAWNSIAEFLPGIDAKDEIPLGDLGGYASGGVLPGYTPGRDVHEFYSPTGGRIHLSGGEAIMRPEWTRAVGGPGAVERMNRAARSGKLDPNQIRTGNEHAFATGGVWDLGGFANGGVLITTAVQSAMRDIVKSKYPGITLTSATRPGHSGYHGTGHATDWSNGTSNTPMQLALAHDIAQTYPGSAQLIYAAPGWASNIYEGSPAGAMDSGVYKTAQAGRHDNHVHWAMTTPPTMQFGGGVFEGGSNGGGVGGAIVNWIADKARSIWSSIVDPIKDKIGGKAGDWGDSSFGEIPGSMFTSMVDAAWSRLSSLFGSGGGSNSGSVDTSNVPGDVVGAVETVFARHGFTGAEWEAAKWIIQKESGWSTTAQNPSSGAFGLFQFNPMGGNTLGAYLPDRNTDPAVQADAGARYMKDRYGSPSAAKRFWEQNQWYANGGVIPSGMGLFDTGGVWKSGTMGMNLSGKNEYVFTNRAMRDFQQATESLQEVAKELGIAFNGGDWGYGELSRYVGEDIARALVNESANLGIAKVEIDEASKGRDWGYGALSRYVGKDIAHAIVNEASWLGGARDEVVAAFKGIDFGLASVARYLGGNEDLARELLDEVSWIGGAVDEVSAAWQGIDFGLASVARYLGGNERLAIGLLNGVESMGTVAKEIGDAFQGGDWGTGEMERYIGSGAARVVFDTARAAGSFIRREHDDYIQAKYGDFGNLAQSLEVIAAGGPTAWGEAASDVINTALTGAFDGSKWLHEDSPLVIAALHVGRTLSQWQGQWAQSELNSELRKSAEDYAMGQARSALGMVGLGDVVDIATGVTQKVQGIMSDEEVRKGVEEVKRVVLDPDGRYSGAEIEKKLRELGIEVDHIKSELGDSLVGGLIGMA